MLLTLLFFVVAMGFSIYCWAKRNGILGLLSLAVWFLFVVYVFGASLTRWDLQYDFGMFGTLMAFIMVITSLYRILQRPKMPDEEEPQEKTVITRVSERSKKLNSLYRSMRGGDEDGL
jgi:hypothetical protein